MGNGMSKTVQGVHVGNLHDAKSKEHLDENKITHILSIHDNAKPMHEDKKYLCIEASDTSAQDLIQFFPRCNDFIHQARLDGGEVLIHCLAGVSRSVTVTAAYIMTVTALSWKDALHAIRGARRCANPNFGFQKQLQVYENSSLSGEKIRLREKYPPHSFSDEEDCKRLLESYQRFVLHGDTSPENDGLYNLPHGSYKNRKKKVGDKEETSAANEDEPDK